MNKKVLFASAVALFATLQAQAQTKIGTNPGAINANAVLELESSTQGLLLPRLSLTSTTSFAPLTAHVAGMVVYNMATSAPVNAVSVTPGYYYNDGTQWQRIGIANAVSNNAGGSRVELATTSTGTTRAAGTEVVFLDNGNVGIGITNPTADLDVNGMARVRNLAAGTAADQVVTTDANGNFRKVTIATLVNGSETKISNTGSNITIAGSGTIASPYTLNSVAENALSTSSNPVTATATSVGVSATNVQNAIIDLATAIKTVENGNNGSQTKVTAGTNITVTGNGTTATPYIINTPAETGLTTAITTVNAAATTVGVSGGNVQAAVENLATAIITNKVKLAAAGTNISVAGTGTASNPYTINSTQTAATTPNTAISSSATSVAVPAGNVQNAIASLATSIAGRDGTEDAWANNTTTNVVELKTKSDGTTTRPGGAQVTIKDNGSMVIGSNKLTYPSRLTLVSDNISAAANNYLGDNLELMAFGNNANNSPYPIVDISSSFGTEATPSNFPNCTSTPIGVGAVRWNARAGGNKIEVARIGVSYVGSGSTNLGEMTFTTAGNSKQLVLSASGGVGVGVKTTTSSFAVTGLENFSGNSAAKSGGLKIGDFYQNTGDVKVVY